MGDTLRFPEGFVWGAATSSFQIEGSTTADGRGPSIWDTFCQQPGRILDRSHGDPACDHYRRWPQDIALMRELGLTAYRFSIAWPRILPHGDDAKPLEAGLSFYDRLVDGLLEAGITPWVTLYHWDLPQALEDRGGWRNRRTVDAFVRYADLVSQRLGDRVTHWITHNEPWCISMLSHQIGEHAPGMQDWSAALTAAHHVLLSHGRAVPVIRRNVPSAQVGLVLNLSPATPASPSEADKQAATWHDGWFNRWFLDPVFHRTYPADMREAYTAAGHLDGADVDLCDAADLQDIATPIDFLGINYYNRAITRSDRIGEEDNLPRTVPVPTAAQCTDMGWEVHADSLRALLIRIHREYGPIPLVITENGAAYGTPPDTRGRVEDSRRVAYFRDHLVACHEALAEGVPLQGYFAWSLLDNFEWAHGYDKRFGLIWVDYETQERILKDSARAYAGIIARHGVLTADPV